ncbi:hypothetical protein GONAM_16_00240 [Gordonia namibiensis NBRC 108229]|uniref:Uncharacterized protein n=1 Tax=Gordonia namibiensis NBRC 108229 TaxID=1208314 RepID=K6XNV6_9ACTN|nr:hypothetical protein [Gordonia namibiensis]GAC00525.1 hypothetical protein GONAM_16_00240 [Gordonia namibiensis NBRC 108229]
MMGHTLLDTITVTQEPAGSWTRAKEPEEFLDRTTNVVVTDICEPAYPLPEPPEVSLGEDFGPQAMVVHAQVPTRCATLDELDAAVSPSANRTAEFYAARHLYYGAGLDDPDEVFLSHADVETVASTGNLATDLGAALAAFYAKTPYGTPLLHLGTEAALTLALGLQNLTVAWYYSPAYPARTIAITDTDVRIQLTPFDTTRSTRTDVNRHQVELTSFFRIVFDVTKAIRVA